MGSIRARDMRDQFEQSRRGLEAFDCDVWVGQPSEPCFRWFDTVGNLERFMDAAGISEALVTHFAALNYDFAEGNELALQWAAESSRLHVAITLVPDSVGEVGGMDAYLDRAIDRKARAVRLFPHAHSFSLAQWCSGPILDALLRRNLPLILWHSETTWDEINVICERYPDLNVIVEGSGRKILYDNRMFYQLLATHANLYLELHNLTNYLIVEDIVHKFGARRLIFGSFAPLCEPGAPLGLIAQARISDADKRLIAGGNQRALLDHVGTGRARA